MKTHFHCLVSVIRRGAESFLSRWSQTTLPREHQIITIRSFKPLLSPYFVSCHWRILNCTIVLKWLMTNTPPQPPPQVCLCPPSGALRATFMPSRSPSMAWAITAKTWPSARPMWRFTIRPRRETAGPAQPPGVCQEVAVSAASTTSPELPPCVSSALKVCKLSCEAQMASGQGAYLLLTVAVGGSICNDTLRTGSQSALSHSTNTGRPCWRRARHVMTSSWKLWLNKHHTRRHTFHPSFIRLIRRCHIPNARWKLQRTDRPLLSVVLTTVLFPEH